MGELIFNNKKSINSLDFEDHLEHYLNIDDDEESSLGAAIFKEMYGISIDDMMDEDEDNDVGNETYSKV